MLAAYGVTKLISSTARRCTSTLLPYAHLRETAVETYSLLTEEEGENDPKGVGTLAARSRPRHSPAVNQPLSACTGRCCRTFLMPLRLRRRR